MFGKIVKITLLGTGLLVILVAAVVAFAYYKGIGTAPQPSNVSFYTSSEPSPTPSLTQSPQQGQPSPTPSATQPAGASPALSLADLRLSIEQTRTPDTSVFFNVTVRPYLRAQLSNLGGLDAQNVQVVARARVGNDYIAIDGKDALVVALGTVPANSAVQKDLTFELRMSLSQGQRAQSEGIIFEARILWDGGAVDVPAYRCSQSGCSSL